MAPFFTTQQLQTILDLIPACVYWKSLEGNFLGCNRAVVDIFGKKSIGEVLGRTSYELFDEL